MIKIAKNEELIEIKNEAKILSSLNSENIVNYFESFNVKDFFNIVMEYCDGLDLRNFINEHKRNNKFINKKLIYHFISDICKGLKDIYNQNLIHRYLKPEN